MPIAALTQSIENELVRWRIEPKTLQHCAAYFQHFDHGAALKIERKMSHLNIAFDRYAYIGTVMHYILVKSFHLNNAEADRHLQASLNGTHDPYPILGL